MDEWGLLFCFECGKLAGYRLEAGRDILVLINIRSLTYFPHRENVSGNNRVLITSSHEMDEIDEFISEFSRKRQRQDDNEEEPLAKRARYEVDVSGMRIIDLSNDQLSDDSSDNSDEFIDYTELSLTPNLDNMQNVNPLSDQFELCMTPFLANMQDDNHPTEVDNLEACFSPFSAGAGSGHFSSGEDYSGILLPQFDVISGTDEQVDLLAFEDNPQLLQEQGINDIVDELLDVHTIDFDESDFYPDLDVTFPFIDFDLNIDF